MGFLWEEYGCRARLSLSRTEYPRITAFRCEQHCTWWDLFYSCEVVSWNNCTSLLNSTAHTARVRKHCEPKTQCTLHIPLAFASTVKGSCAEVKSLTCCNVWNTNKTCLMKFQKKGSEIQSWRVGFGRARWWLRRGFRKVDVVSTSLSGIKAKRLAAKWTVAGSHPGSTFAMSELCFNSAVISRNRQAMRKKRNFLKACHTNEGKTCLLNHTLRTKTLVRSCQLWRMIKQKNVRCRFEQVESKITNWMFS